MASSDDGWAVDGRAVFGTRLVAGLVQGLALYLLYLAYDDKTWPATNGLLFAPLVATALYVPLLLSQGLGNLRGQTLAVWMVLAACVTALFAGYDIWHGWPTEFDWHNGGAEIPRRLPEFATFFFTAAFLFIAQALTAAGDGARKIVAPYPAYFDLAWKQGLQLALSAVFVGLFWILLWLGAALFQLINLDFLQKLIEHRWFAIPATTLAIACAFHITDVRSILVRGARTLVHALFSWLLPLIALIGAGFLVGLVFTGLEPLWATRRATSLLLIAAAWLVVLINAAYQDGEAEHRPVRFLRIAGSLGGLLLVPLVGLAAYALYLRVAQYGWTADRIAAAACVVVAAVFAGSYAVAALWPKDWFKPLERWNVWTAFLVLAVIGALFSPLADPARISVASQVAQLETGKIAPQKFDFYYLHREGGRFGKAALEKLAAGKNPAIAGPAQDALKNRYVSYSPPPAPEPADLAKRFKVYPAGAKLPESFLQQNWQGDGDNFCLSGSAPADGVCDAVLVPSEGRIDVFVIYNFGRTKSAARHLTVYRQAGALWQQIGQFTGPICDPGYAALLAGRFTLAVPEQRDLVIGGQRLKIAPSQSGRADCR